MAKPRAVAYATGGVVGEIVPATNGRLCGGLGGRTEARVAGLLCEACDVLQDAHFALRGIRWRAGEALAGRRDWRSVLAEVQEIGTLLDGPHRALYALARFEEDAAGQLTLPINADRRAVA